MSIPYVLLIDSIFKLVDFVTSKIKEDKQLETKTKEELIKYFEEKFKEINDRLKPLSR